MSHTFLQLGNMFYDLFLHSPVFVLSFFTLTYPPSAVFFISILRGFLYFVLPITWPSAFHFIIFLIQYVVLAITLSIVRLITSLSLQTFCLIDALSPEYAN